VRRKGASQSIKAVLGISFEEFEKEWKEFLGKKRFQERAGVSVRRYKIKEGRADEERMEMEEIKVKISPEGLMIKADTIGALEALCNELETKSIGVMSAKVGPVSRHDLIEVETIKNPCYRVLLAFNTPILPDAADMIKGSSFSHLKVIDGSVILIDAIPELAFFGRKQAPVEWRSQQGQRHRHLGLLR
jgi:translation initiation factor IF-2